MSSPLPNFVTLARQGFRRQRLVLLDCVRGQTAELTKFPAHLGHTAEADWKALSLPQGQAGCLLETAEDGRFRLTAENPRGVRVNGNLVTNTCELDPGITLVQVGRELIALAADVDSQEQIGKVQTDDWRLFRIADGGVEAVTRFRELPELLRQRGLDPVRYAAAPVGLDSGFHVTQVYEALGVGVPVRQDHTEAPVLDGSQGAYTCPVCWLKFDAGDAMNIAAHDSLRGDPILGEDARLRFFPTRFNDLGQAIDPLGLSSADLACPHCRRRLPPGFLEVPQFIFSIVGAPSAGKTYYLSILLKMLQQTLFREFGLVLKDSDPTGNMLLNQMKNRLFSASQPEEAILAKPRSKARCTSACPAMAKWSPCPGRLPTRSAARKTAPASPWMLPTTRRIVRLFFTTTLASILSQEWTSRIRPALCMWPARRRFFSSSTQLQTLPSAKSLPARLTRNWSPMRGSTSRTASCPRWKSA
jgi:hypothetical protein